MHNVEQGFAYSAGKIWNGNLNENSDVNAAVLWQTWGRMVATTPTMIKTAGVRVDDKMCVVAGKFEPTLSPLLQDQQITVLYGHYEQSRFKNNGEDEKTLPRRAITVELKNLPWTSWSWSQQDNTAPAALVVNATGVGTVPVCRPEFALEDAIGSRTNSLEARTCV
jgi:hypothetical protein